jgi:hypothetical protein
MRPEFDREFDALLRRTAGGSSSVQAPGERTRRALSSPHLDADERAAFAEAAVPPAARAAYVAHLADCDECRGAVASLSAAAGLSFELEKREAAAGTGAPVESPSVNRGSWLGALFAPRLLRFAAPALALSLVGVVSFVALRSDRGRAGFNSASQVEAPSAPADSARDLSASGNANMAMNSNSAAVAEVPALANANLTGTGTAGRGGEVAGGTTGAGAGPLAATTGTRTDQAAAAAQSSGNAPEGERQQAAAATASAPAAPAPEARDEQKRQEAVAEHDSREMSESRNVTSDRANRARNNYELQTPDGSRSRARSNQVLDGGSAAPPPPPAPREEAQPKTAQPSAPGRAVARRSGNAAGEETMRTVEGRRFRRTGGVWVDENYRESLPTTGVRRGTEAYRALVSELPEVGRIAESLSGEVVIVARGRVYRIRP